jgi:hypothetical protein
MMTGAQYDCERELKFCKYEMTMKNVVFWDVTPGDSCKNRRFRGT